MLVIDEDVGKSGTTAEIRDVFQRLVAEVGLDHVGIVLGVEMSRLARSNRDWHPLLEVCALFGTLIGDLDGVYDPWDDNDRLILGLQGTMSEAELHVLKQWLWVGQQAKARRGELRMQVPMGYVRRPSGDVVKDPDEQAQAVLGLIFEQFERQGTIGSVLRYLVHHGIKLPCRAATGAHTGELTGAGPTYRPSRMSCVIRCTRGAYVYGRRRIDGRRQRPGRPATSRQVATPEEWYVLLQDHHPAYIPWEQFERNHPRSRGCGSAWRISL